MSFKNNNLSTMRVCFIFAIALLYDVYGEENYIDGIIASVNNMPILYSDVKNVAMAMKYDKNNSKTISEVDILKDLIDQNLIISSEPNISLDIHHRDCVQIQQNHQSFGL